MASDLISADQQWRRWRISGISQLAAASVPGVSGHGD
jgi:hypothetical protein